MCRRLFQVQCITQWETKPEHRSQLHAIQVVALVTLPLLIKYGIDAILDLLL